MFNTFKGLYKHFFSKFSKIWFTEIRLLVTFVVVSATIVVFVCFLKRGRGPYQIYSVLLSLNLSILVEQILAVND